MTQFELTQASIADINAAFDAGALSSERLVQMYLDRIEAYDEAGPRINAVLTLNCDALVDSARARRGAPRDRTPLAAARHSSPAQRRVRHRRHADHRRLPAAQGREADVRLHHCQTSARGRCDHARQGQPERLVRPARHHGEQHARRLDAQSVRARPHARLVQRRHRRGHSPRTSAPSASAARPGFSIRTPTSDSNLFGLSTTSGLISRAGQMWSYITGERGGPMAHTRLRPRGRARRGRRLRQRRSVDRQQPRQHADGAIRQLPRRRRACRRARRRAEGGVGLSPRATRRSSSWRSRRSGCSASTARSYSTPSRSVSTCPTTWRPIARRAATSASTRSTSTSRARAPTIRSRRLASCCWITPAYPDRPQDRENIEHPIDLDRDPNTARRSRASAELREAVIALMDRYGARRADLPAQAARAAVDWSARRSRASVPTESVESRIRACRR